MHPLKPVLVTLAIVLTSVAATADDSGYVDKFDVNRADLASTGRGAFFILEPGYRHEYAGGGEQLIITVLDETKAVDGVETRVVEERESKDGKLVEVSRNFFAIDRKTGDVYYFGEEVDEYGADGNVSGHGGAWLSGEKGARFGLFMPNSPRPGLKFYQEIAPTVAMDRVEIAGVDETVEVPAGKFSHCVKTVETTPLAAGELEHKYYAPKVGLLVDGKLKLVKHGPREK